MFQLVLDARPPLVGFSIPKLEHPHQLADRVQIPEMAAKHLLEIERAIHQLSAKEKLWLLERIARQLREPDETELLEMASDPEIQAKIVVIDHEFALTEMDGLQSA